MRELKFRGWHTSLNKMFSAEEMAEDQLTLMTTGCFINVNGKSTKLSTIYPSDKFIPLQFTGLKDKNGKEIYEGDIVQRGVIIFSNGKFQGQYFGDGQMYETWEDDLCQERGLEVLGNIYENPELLKK